MFVRIRRVGGYFLGSALALLSLSVLLPGQDPKLLIARVRERVLATVDRLPNYMWRAVL